MTRRLQLRLGWLLWGIAGVVAPEWTVRRFERATLAGVVAPEWRVSGVRISRSTTSGDGFNRVP